MTARWENRWDETLSSVGVDGDNIEPLAVDVLHRLHKKIGEPVSRDSLYREIWGVPYKGMEWHRGVDVRVSALRRAMRKDGSPFEIVTIRGVGYMLRPMAKE